MNWLKKWIFWPLCIGLLALPAGAETVRGLYGAQVVAADRSAEALASASREALAQVLVKVSGSPAVLEYPDIAAALTRARGYVRQYSYLAREPEGVGVRFEFDPASITSLVTDAGAPLWTANRPVVLVWLVVDDPDGPRFVARDSEPQVTAALLEAFARRGVPVQLPLLDLADATAVRADEVWRGSLPAVELASRRYDRQDILVGRLSFDAEAQAAGDWRYLSRTGRQEVAVEPGGESRFMDAGVGLVAEAMAARYAVAATGEEAEGILMSVVGVESYSEYAAVVSWLERVELVDHANVVRVLPDRIQLRLVTRADAEQMAGILRLNPRFQPVPSGDINEELSYQWQN